MKYRFGKVIGGRYEGTNERVPKVVAHVKVNLKRFYSIEYLGVECNNPKWVDSATQEGKI